MENNFGRALTIGVEEELQLIDPETLALAPGVEKLLGPDGLKTELFSCLIETNTPVCESAEEARGRARPACGVRCARPPRARASRSPGQGRIRSRRAEEQEIVAEPRYLRMLEELGPELRRQLVCGLHVHVGMESFEACLRTLAAIVPWLPDVLALSLNSPYVQGAETGALSSRAARLGELPRGAQPPAFASPEDWETYIEATGEDYTRSWWDARPHPRLGTIEVRIPDQPTDVDRSAALAALIQALCAVAPAPADGRHGTRISSGGRRLGAERLGRRSCSRWSSRQRESSAPGTSSRSCASRRRRSASSRRVVAMGSRRVVAELVERTAA